jgi:hypothetical protein
MTKIKERRRRRQLLRRGRIRPGQIGTNKRDRNRVPEKSKDASTKLVERAKKGKPLAATQLPI